MTEFNFDEWAALCKSNPREFESKRKDLLAAEIAKSPVEKRNELRILQMQCDAIRESMPALEAAHAMLLMAQESLKKLKTPLTQLRAECENIGEQLNDLK